MKKILSMFVVCSFSCHIFASDLGLAELQQMNGLADDAAVEYQNQELRNSAKKARQASLEKAQQKSLARAQRHHQETKEHSDKRTQGRHRERDEKAFEQGDFGSKPSHLAMAYLQKISK